MKKVTRIATLFTAAALCSSILCAQGVKRPYGFTAETAPARTPQILYHGGPLLLNSIRTYIIYYGTFPSSTTSILDDFFTYLGGTPQFAVNTTYYDGSNNHITGAISFSTAANVYFDNYSMGKSLSSSTIEKVISAAINGGHLPVDTGAVYFLVSAPDVKVIGFCNSFCAYHNNSSTIVTGSDIKYAVIPDPTQACSGCDGNVAIYGETTTPNGDMGADEMTDSIMHELSEAASDPDINAWYTRGGAENGDLCNFNYGTTYIAPNGSHANAHIGNRDYLIQTIWQNTSAGFCANTLQ